MRENLAEIQKDPEMLKGNFARVIKAVVDELEELCPGEYAQDNPFRFQVVDSGFERKYQSKVITGVTIVKSANQIHIRRVVQARGRLPIPLGNNTFDLVKKDGEWFLKDFENEHHRGMFYLFLEDLAQLNWIEAKQEKGSPKQIP